MYLHLGQNVVIRMKDIIGIFDLETTTISTTTRDYLAAVQKAGRVVSIPGGIPKSFILCCGKDGETTVYTSQISSSTLMKRAGFFRNISNVSGERK
jgi:hypothetical protein